MNILITYANDTYRNTQSFCSFTGKYIGQFDKIINYSETDIDDDFKRKHNAILSIKRGNGLWLWKPYFILKTLNHVSENDVIFYCDSGSFFIKSIKTLLRSMKNDDIWVSNTPLIEKQFTQKKTFKLMDCDDNKYYQTNHIQASFIALRKNRKTIDFVNEWLRYCCNKDILKSNKNNCFSNDKEIFIAHREDQSILSLLCKKHDILPHRDPSQFGKIPEKYGRDKRVILKIPEHSDKYKTIIILHRKANIKPFIFFKQFLIVILPLKIVKRLIRIPEIQS